MMMKRKIQMEVSTSQNFRLFMSYGKKEDKQVFYI